jgi:hypothetical protein
MFISLYIIALIPIVVGFAFWIKTKEVVLWEWALSSVIAVISVAVMNAAVYCHEVGDDETWSGVALRAKYVPRWVEEYTELVSYSDGDGHTHTTVETRYRTHPETWHVMTTLTDDQEIDRGAYDSLTVKWGKPKAVTGYRPGYYSGDHHDYITAYTSGKPVVPVSENRRWSNRLRAADTMFEFERVDKVRAKAEGLYEWPKSDYLWQSNRLLGHCENISPYGLDLLNAVLGPAKEANVIIIGFGDCDKSKAVLQQAYWQGGKKNDIVICYGKTWAYAFGWSYDNKVFRDLETAVMDYKADHARLDDAVLARFKTIIWSEYKRRNWADFDYIALTPPWWSYIVTIFVMLVTQAVYYWWAFTNDYGKCTTVGHHIYGIPFRSGHRPRY